MLRYPCAMGAALGRAAEACGFLDFGVGFGPLRACFCAGLLCFGVAIKTRYQNCEWYTSYRWGHHPLPGTSSQSGATRV